MKCVITGAVGFIGSHLCDRFLGEGYEVVAVDNLCTGQRDNVAHLAAEPRFTLLEQDVTLPFTVPGKLDYVLHFASPASPSPSSRIGYLQMPIETLKANSLGTLNALELARAKGAAFLFASTSEIYGDPHVTPQREDYTGNVQTIAPRSCYDEAKRFGEAAVMAYHRQHRLQTRIVRIFNTYGPRMRLDDGRVLPNFLGQALRDEPITIYGDGSQTRSFCYVDDLIEGIVRLLRSNFHEPVNLGNPAEISIMTLAREVIELTKSSSQLVFEPIGEGDPKRRKPDITRARQILGWEPKIGRGDGLRRTLEYFRSLIPPRSK